MTPVRVILADDHPVWREGIRSILEANPGITVIAEAGGGLEALRLARSLEADVLVLDMEMPDLSGVEVARAVQAEELPVRVLALSAYSDPIYVQSLLQLGAAGYVTKDKPPSLIAEAVLGVAAGEGRWFVQTASMKKSAADSLTERERAVLLLLAEGRSNGDIASALFVSESTVRNHLTSVYAKLGLGTSREAVAWAWKTGLAS